MNKLQMMNLNSHISKVWDQGDHRKAFQIASNKLGTDSLNSALESQGIDMESILDAQSAGRADFLAIVGTANDILNSVKN